MLGFKSEQSLITGITKDFVKSERQINNLHESDSELIKIEEISEDYCLAITMDSIVEEIETGLYDSPYLWGWMVVMANLSDLAAVGAKPLGVMISETILTTNPQHLEHVQRGICDACHTAGTFVLGGDTSISNKFGITGAALGFVERKSIMLRKGCVPGDRVFTTNFLGRGNAYAFLKFGGNNINDFKYKPMARLFEGRLIANFASACMDSSDGLAGTLDELMKQNEIGFSITNNIENIICQESISIALNAKINPILFLIAQHGEFELVFTIPERNLTKFLQRSHSEGFYPIELGYVTEQPEVQMNTGSRMQRIDTSFLREISFTSESVQDYIEKLFDYSKILD